MQPRNVNAWPAIRKRVFRETHQPAARMTRLPTPKAAARTSLFSKTPQLVSQTIKPSTDKALYRESVERIREKNSDVIINLTTGPGARFFHDEKDPSKPSADSREIADGLVVDFDTEG